MGGRTKIYIDGNLGGDRIVFGMMHSENGDRTVAGRRGETSYTAN